MSDDNTGIRRWDGSASANDWALGSLVPIRLGLAPSRLGWSERGSGSRRRWRRRRESDILR
jgi:hypothetical protein